MHKWMHSNSSNLTEDSEELTLSNGWQPDVQLRRQSTGFADARDTAGNEDDPLDFSWPPTVRDARPHWLLTPKSKQEQQRLDAPGRPRSLDSSSLDESPPPPPPRWSRGSSGDSSDSAWYLDDDSCFILDTASPATDEEGDEEDSEFLFVPHGSGSDQEDQLKSIQEILREGGSSSLYFSSALPSNGRCLYPILEESSDEISDATVSEVEEDEDPVFKPVTEALGSWKLHQTLIAENASTEELLNCENQLNGHSSSSSTSNSTSTSTHSSESSEASVDFEQQYPTQLPQQPEIPQQLQTVEDMRRWSLRLQPQQLDAIAEAESAASSSSSSSSDTDDAPDFDGSVCKFKSEKTAAVTQRNTDISIASAAVSAQVRVVASSKAQVRDTNDQPTGDEASAITEATGATVNVAVARAAARAASIATSTVVRNGGGVGRYRILISTQCDVEHHPGTSLPVGDINDGWCQPLEDSHGQRHLPEQSSVEEHILKLLPVSDQNSQSNCDQSIHTVVTEEQLLVTSSEASIPQPEASVESAYIASSGDEGSTSETDKGDTTESDNFQTSESDSGAVQWTELRAQAAAYRSVLQQPLSLKESESASLPSSSVSHNRLQTDVERLRRAKETCLSGRNSLREQLLDRGQYQPSLSTRYEPPDRPKTRRNSDESQSFDVSIVGQPLREILGDDFVRKGHQQQQKLLGCRSTDLDKLDDLDSDKAPRGGTVVSLLETQPGQFNSVSLFDLSRSALACTSLGSASFSPSLMETNIDTGEETYHDIVKETDVDTLKRPSTIQSPASIKSRSRSLLNLTGLVDSQDRRSAAEIGVGNAISRSSLKRKSKKKKKERKSFIERLEERATTDPEKEICRSLSRLRIPSWMDKVPLNGCNSSTLETTSRYSRHKDQASRASMSFNDLAISAALQATEATERKSDEIFMNPPEKVEEGYLSPVILPTSVSLPCLLAVRPEEMSLVIEANQVAPGTQNQPTVNSKPASAAAKTRSQLLSEGQEARRQRLVELQSGMHRPSLEPVTLIPKDFVPRTSQPPTEARSKQEKPTSVRANALAIAAASIAASSHKTAQQPSSRPPPPPPRMKPKSEFSTRNEAVSVAGVTDTASLQPAADSFGVPPPPPPRSAVAQRMSSPHDAVAIASSTKETNEMNRAPPPPSRGPVAQRLSSREEALKIASAAAKAMSKEASSKVDDLPPPPPKRTSAQFLSPDWQESTPSTRERESKSQKRKSDHKSAVVPSRTPQMSREQQEKSSPPQLQLNRQANRHEDWLGTQLGQSSTSDATQSSIPAKNVLYSNQSDHATEQHVTAPQLSSLDHETKPNGSVSNSLDSNANNSSHSFDLENQASPQAKPSPIQGFKMSSPMHSDYSPTRSHSGSDKAVEESTVVQTSVVYRRIFRQTVECSPHELERQEVNSGSSEVRPITLTSIRSCQKDPDIVDEEAQREMLALVDSQLEQFEESIAELEKGGFQLVGNYAEMIAALEATRDESLSNGAALSHLFREEPVALDAACRQVLVEWLLRRPETHRRLARLARASHRCLGRGSVLLVFAIDSDSGVRDLQKPPAYAPIDELREAVAVAASAELMDACAAYNPEDEFIACLAVGGARLWARLATEPQREQMPQPPPRERRQLFVTSLRRSLRDRGVSLRHHYPELHDLLEAYADTGEVFAPVTIRPMDAVSGRSFACSIAVPSAQDCDWWASEHLLGDQQQMSEAVRSRRVVSTEL